MSLYKSLFKQTAIYGIATVLPRIISSILNPIFVYYLTDKEKMGEVSVIFSYLIFFNVILSYGMETAFFRFYNSESDKNKVISTSTISLFCSTIVFLVVFILFQKDLALWSEINVEYIVFTIWILALDALAIIPFSKIRAECRPIKYAVIKISNVLINLFLNLLFLIFLPDLANESSNSLLQIIYHKDFQIGYIFVANLIASLVTLVMVLPDYFKIKRQFDVDLWKKMMQYGLPILIAGIAFAINEHFDKILLDWMQVDMADIGAYSACYKIGVFMVLFRTAYSLGIEPFFFSHAKNENAPQTYATITKYFVIFGSFICLGVIVFADILKLILVPKAIYWDAMHIVPLIVLANFFLGIYTNLSVWYKLNNKTHIGAYISIVGALVTLALNFWLIPLYSYYGSAVATIFAYGSMMFLSYYLGQKQYPIPYPIKEISIYLGSSIAIGFGVFYFLRAQYWITIPVLALYLGWIYKQEKIFFQKILRAKETKG